MLLTFTIFAQFSKTHYIPPLSGSDDFSSSAQEQYLYISTPNITPVNFTINQLGNIIISGTVSKSTPYIYNIGFGTSTQLMIQASDVNSIRSDKGFIIEAEDLIYVSVRVIAGNANQSGAIVSKGLAALGKEFRIGALLNTTALGFSQRHYTFVAILATENNTLVQFSDIKPGVILINNSGVGNSPASITLNSGQSFVMAVEGPIPDANRDGLIGALVSSDKPIAVNCGSFTGTNANNNLDLGFDQIVSAERTGTEYIFIKSTGQAVVERALIVAHENNTEIYLNGNTGFYDYLLNAGEYIALDGNDYDSLGNLYVRTTKKVFAYQTIGDNSRTDFANQELFFVPPLSCQTPRVIDNIPLINEIGTRIYSIARVTLIKETGKTLSFEINGVPYSIASLNALPGVTIIGPNTVVTTSQSYDTYVITGISGNFGAFSSGQLYFAAYGTDGAATFGGFYSGFTTKPEISFDLLVSNQNNCIPNTELSVNTLSPFDTFQWYFNGIAITGATNSSYIPREIPVGKGPGYYYVKATIASCGTELRSDEIPVSLCPTNGDSDTTNDNIDIDNDNDGILNCIESLGNQNDDLSNLAILNIVTTGTGTPSPTPFTGNTTGDFVMVTAIGKNNTVSFEKTYIPTSLSLEYVTTATANNLLSDDSEFIVNTDINKTITVLNPTNQLLIDTNYDGIYESGITKFSSFEIRCRLNSVTPLAAGTGTFKFQTHLTTSIKVTCKNLSDTNASRATFKLIKTCIPKNSGDGDSITDDLDLDSDNDGIPDTVEAQGQNFVAFSSIDSNNDGLADVFGTGFIPIDNDADSYPDVYDLDSDNDGIFDVNESGSPINLSSNNGYTISFTTGAFGINGLDDLLETFPDSGILNYTIADTDTDLKKNYREIDSDNDSCYDTIEAGFIDGDNDGILDILPTTIIGNGLVFSASGYAVPNGNYIIPAPIAITTQPSILPICELLNTSISVVSTPVTSYQWQVFIGGIWTNIIDNATYIGSTTSSMQINTVAFAMNGQKYRVKLQKNGNSCGLISDEAILTIYDLPIINSPLQLLQCDDNNDGISDINLRQMESLISTTTNKTFTYYKTNGAAIQGNVSSIDFINNPSQFNSGNALIWVRVEDNTHGCFRIAQLNVVVSVTQIPSTFQNPFYKCDDFLDANGNNNSNNNDYDGIASFNFSSVSTAINAILPLTTSYTIKYYKNQIDASLETDSLGNSLEISQNLTDTNSIYNYRNIEYPNQQKIWVRVESILDNACFALGPYVTLTVELRPKAYPINTTNIIRRCDDNQDGNYPFETSSIEPLILNGQTGVNVSYFELNGTALPSPLPNPFVVNTTKTIRIKVSNNSTLAPDGPCDDEQIIQFIVDDLPQAFTISSSLLNVCDDEPNPINQDGLFEYDTSTFENLILNGQTGMIVKYYDKNGVQLSSPLPNPFNTSTQNVTVTVENPINTTCKAMVTLPFIVNKTPKIDLNNDGSDDVLLCVNLINDSVELSAVIIDGTSITNYTYQWFLDGTAIPSATHSTYSATIRGNYAVEVTNVFGCPMIRTIKVDVSETATIEDIKIIDLADSNSVEVIVSGLGNYVYSLDSANYFQESNIFPNVSAGIHEVYVNDLNLCGIIGPIEIAVLGVPKFFTPNGDGYNDYWNIKGVNSKLNTKTIIKIFDKFGKFLQLIDTTSDGWDGTFNGNALPSEDYWYSILFEDNRIVKGHFSLKR